MLKTVVVIVVDDGKVQELTPQLSESRISEHLLLYDRYILKALMNNLHNNLRTFSRFMPDEVVLVRHYHTKNIRNDDPSFSLST